MSACLRYLLFGILCLVLLSTQASAQEILWETHNEEGNHSYQQGKYAEAEKQFLAALREAEKFGSADRRLARASPAWQHSTAHRANTTTQSHFTSGHWRLTKRFWGRKTLR